MSTPPCSTRSSSVVDGKFKGGNIVFGLKDNGVGLGKISPKVPKSEVAKVMKVRADIIAGKIKNIPTEVPDARPDVKFGQAG